MYLSVKWSNWKNDLKSIGSLLGCRARHFSVIVNCDHRIRIIRGVECVQLELCCIAVPDAVKCKVLGCPFACVCWYVAARMPGLIRPQPPSTTFAVGPVVAVTIQINWLQGWQSVRPAVHNVNRFQIWQVVRLFVACRPNERVPAGPSSSALWR